MGNLCRCLNVVLMAFLVSGGMSPLDFVHIPWWTGSPNHVSEGCYRGCRAKNLHILTVKSPSFSTISLYGDNNKTKLFWDLCIEIFLILCMITRLWRVRNAPVTRVYSSDCVIPGLPRTGATMNTMIMQPPVTRHKDHFVMPSWHSIEFSFESSIRIMGHGISLVWPCCT